jgi:hypothetical protein
MPVLQPKGIRKRLVGLLSLQLLVALLLPTHPIWASGFDADDSFEPMGKVVSLEGDLEHFGSDRLNSAFINAWNVGARISLLPFGVIHNEKVLRGLLDGAPEVGLEPTFERFNTVHQNFGGVLLEIRYHLLDLHFGRFVPWIGGAIGPGGSDLNIGQASDDTKLTGPFLALIKGEVGVTYFLDSHKAVYLGLQAQHVSNGGFNGRDLGATTNESLNTPWGLIAGICWFLR